IRSVWPANIADHAIAIAQRESNLIPTARNYCCVGLFALYASIYANFARSLGYSVDQFTDPYVNSVIAYQTYLRQGWAPWA
ncbi:MAG TPA: hypothetical protein VFE86_20230, partial [Ilumatobacteraceae bacterium]|nr:hypothetical protein [Ilumatobacteraceae bacterium]